MVWSSMCMCAHIHVLRYQVPRYHMSSGFHKCNLSVFASTGTHARTCAHAHTQTHILSLAHSQHTLPLASTHTHKRARARSLSRILALSLLRSGAPALSHSRSRPHSLSRMLFLPRLRSLALALALSRAPERSLPHPAFLSPSLPSLPPTLLLSLSHPLLVAQHTQPSSRGSIVT